MNKGKLIFIALILAAGILTALLFVDSRPGGAPRSGSLELFCAAGMRIPVSAIADEYEKEYGVSIIPTFSGSGTLLSNIEAAKGMGDLYLAADSSYTAIAKEKGLLAETMPVSFLTAGLGVPAGNPKKITSLADLKRPGLKVGIASPDAASVGKFTKEILSQHGLWSGLKTEVEMPTVNELANVLKLGTIDVAILWDAIANQYPEIDFVHTPEFDAETMDVTIGVLKSADNPTAALHFARYLTARDKGLKAFAENGYKTLSDADVWKDRPKVLLYSGAMLRPAIEKTIEEFEKREGIEIEPVYNGCGILVSQMKAGENPDAYFSCDIKFMDMVEDRFLDPTTVSANEMVILVKKGNPKGITSLEDLKEPGLSLGFAHAQNSALGFLTKWLLEKEGLYDDIVAAGNIELESATGDFLVNQIKTGSLDGVIVYQSNAMADPSTLEQCDLVKIDRPNAVAKQPWAIGKNSEHKHLLSRFYKAAVSAEGKEHFLDYGFRWELKE